VATRERNIDTNAEPAPELTVNGSVLVRAGALGAAVDTGAEINLKETAPVVCATVSKCATFDIGEYAGGTGNIALSIGDMTAESHYVGVVVAGGKILSAGGGG
jgi:hypothetical protein